MRQWRCGLGRDGGIASLTTFACHKLSPGLIVWQDAELLHQTNAASPRQVTQGGLEGEYEARAHKNMIKHAVVLYHARYAREVITDILLKIK